MEAGAIGIIGLVLLVGLLLALPLKELVTYIISVRSRRHFACPKCGERIMMEHGAASACSACGAPLREAERH